MWGFPEFNQVALDQGPMSRGETLANAGEVLEMGPDRARRRGQRLDSLEAGAGVGA